MQSLQATFSQKANALPEITNEHDLRKFFAQYGCVREVKIVNDRAGISKGYGFITFETQEDAQKILQEAKKLNYKDKKLNIGPAIRKQQTRIPRSNVIPEGGTMYLTTSSGYPYIYHNGVAYFHTPEVASVQQPWPSRTVSSSPVVLTQPVYQPPTCHYQAPTQCLPGQWQWSVSQSPTSSPSLFYLHPSEVIYQPVGIAQEGGCVPSPFLLVEAAVPEPFSDHGVQATPHQPFAQNAVAMPAPVSQTKQVKGCIFAVPMVFIQWNILANIESSVEHSLLSTLGSFSVPVLIFLSSPSSVAEIINIPASSCLL
ncbi:protein boule-like isoform X2 [Lagopus leucura]|uniref:protein boule-like isoform X2 n=1 Tax=Lagopus leucura TaxID=30410 RepID=UPI001C685B8F|nr:protein boule-like isoform X2 [Lagopus leucura]